ncbi:MAG: hypothetical protein UT29_C0001G0006 [Candidatus Yanofskybacteria bacterium GW2011_GWA1_39_13]|uniref:BACON domain-containing protein n=1 Tax=Yanofskybacteria sp. (strain GW2011_GWA1_39_13) TaxID=1619019 RepID=A0A0G0MQ03_YANXG|nr:MAG: hypothetical protein UT29_C0001G0006 [Candidatus Yanofskybacteria bacterium GW2011_GWA1_39_13]
MNRCVGIVLVLVFFGFGCGEDPSNPTSPTLVGACHFNFLPTKVVTSSLPQRIVAQVRTGNSCSWVATTADSWIEIAYQGSSGTGDLILNLERNQCTSRARTGFVWIKGSENFLEIFQDGSDLEICPKVVLETTP